MLYLGVGFVEARARNEEQTSGDGERDELNERAGTARTETKRESWAAMTTRLSAPGFL